MLVCAYSKDSNEPAESDQCLGYPNEKILGHLATHRAPTENSDQMQSFD